MLPTQDIIKEHNKNELVDTASIHYITCINKITVEKGRRWEKRTGDNIPLIFGTEPEKYVKCNMREHRHDLVLCRCPIGRAHVTTLIYGRFWGIWLGRTRDNVSLKIAPETVGSMPTTIGESQGRSILCGDWAVHKTLPSCVSGPKQI